MACAAAIGATFTTTLGAFGDKGHRVIGTIAEHYLKNTRALTEVRRILRPNETLADASVWPDTIKDPLYEDGDTAMFRLNHPAHDTYHYANLPFQADRYALDVPGARPTDIVQTMRECIRVLRTGKGSFTPREALRLLAHFVGDIHQPLHGGNGFISESGPLQFVTPKGPGGWRTTLGGNSLVYGPENRFNMHSYWDTHIVNIASRQDAAPAFAARLVATIKPLPAWTMTGDPDGWPAQWATEGLGHAKAAYKDLRLVSYLGPDDAKRTAHRWLVEQPAGYDDAARPVVERQLAAGGYRLAAVLRAIWP